MPTKRSYGHIGYRVYTHSIEIFQFVSTFDVHKHFVQTRLRPMFDRSVYKSFSSSSSRTLHFSYKFFFFHHLDQFSIFGIGMLTSYVRELCYVRARID